MLKALIVEDDILLAHRIKKTISNKFESTICSNGLITIDILKQEKYDLIIADIILPKLNAIGIIEYFKQENIIMPILVIASSEFADEKSQVMEYPMAEYFVKNTSLNDIIAKIDNLIQRFNNKQDTSIISYKELTIDLNNEIAMFDNKVLPNIKGKYLELLHFLVLNNNIQLKKEEIFERVWGVNSETTINAIEVYISGIRKELKKVGCSKYLKTIRGIGYSLE